MGDEKMTKEQAIHILRMELPCYDDCPNMFKHIRCEDCDFQKAVDMAVEALEQIDELCENLAYNINEKNKLKRLLASIQTNDIEHKAYSKGLADGRAIARQHGEWRGNSELKEVSTRICASCGIRGATGYFCMWCGADMRKKEGDDE